MKTLPQTDCSDITIAELLPWYANGTLDDIDQTRVQRHIAQCPVCEQALALLQLTNDAVAQDPVSIPPADRSLKAVMQRIQQESDASQTQEDTLTTTVETSRPNVWQKMNDWVADLASGLSAPQWAAAFLLVLTVTFVLQQSLDTRITTDAPYTVLSSEQQKRDIVIRVELNQTIDREHAGLLISEALPAVDSAVDWLLVDNRLIDVSVAIDQLPAGEEIPLINQLIQQLEQHPQVSKTELAP